MALTFDSGSFRISISTSTTNSPAGSISNPTDVLTVAYDWGWTAGPGNNQAQLEYDTEQTLTQDSEDVFDLSALTDSHQNTLKFSTVKFIAFINLSTTAEEDLLLQADAINGFDAWVLPGSSGNTAGVTVRAGTASTDPGAFTIIAPGTGYVVTEGESDKLTVVNTNEASVTYRLILVGTGTAT